MVNAICNAIRAGPGQVEALALRRTFFTICRIVWKYIITRLVVWLKYHMAILSFEPWPKNWGFRNIGIWNDETVWLSGTGELKIWNIDFQRCLVHPTYISFSYFPRRKSGNFYIFKFQPQSSIFTRNFDGKIESRYYGVVYLLCIV
jgi:hypothetical protein